MSRVFRHLRPMEEDVAEDDGNEAQETAGDVAAVDQPRALNVEVAYALEDVGHRGKEAEERCELARHVETDERDDRLGEQHLDRSDERDGCEHLDGRPGGGWGRLREAEPLCFAPLENCCVRFAAEEQPHEEDLKEEEEYRPLCPAPAFPADPEGADQGSERRMLSSSRRPGHNYIGLV